MRFGRIRRPDGWCVVPLFITDVPPQNFPDRNGDYVIDSSDLGFVLTNWGTEGNDSRALGQVLLHWHERVFECHGYWITLVRPYAYKVVLYDPPSPEIPLLNWGGFYAPFAQLTFSVIPGNFLKEDDDWQIGPSITPYKWAKWLYIETETGFVLHPLKGTP